MAINIGEPAPSFTLLDSNMETVSLADFKGKPLVILFFPFAFSGVCTKELCHMQDNMKRYESLGVQLLGISVDAPYSLKKFKEEYKLDFPMLSDFNKTVSPAYGAFYEMIPNGLKGVSKRAVFVIDKEGKIQYHEILENAGNLPNFESLEEQVSKIN